MRRVQWVLLVCLIGPLVGGCGLKMATPLSAAGVAVELHQTPFHPQSEYQCGPAALAMVLGAAGRPVAPDALVDQVYVPAREGSLAPEMLAAARRHGLVPVSFNDTHAPLDTLSAALHAGRPVLVMQNLGTRFFPAWHYAVVIGLDPKAKTVILRSGTEARLVMPLRRFERSWRGSGYWAFTLHEPAAPPDWAALPDWMQTVAVWDRTRPEDARTAADAAALRWSAHPAPWLALGNLHHADGAPEQAVAAFRTAQSLKPSVGGAHNLALILAMEGCTVEAEQVLDDLPETLRRHPALQTARERVQSLSGAAAGKTCAF